MASLIEKVRGIIRGHSGPHEYPDRCCVSLLLDVVRLSVKDAPDIPYLSERSEARAMTRAIRAHGSWPNWFRDWAGQYGAAVEDGSLYITDLLMFWSITIPSDTPHVGFVGMGEWIYTRGEHTILPVPPKAVSTIHHYRLEF